MNISRFALLFCTVFQLGALNPLISYAQANAEQATIISADMTPDVRIIIDISGSMKQNDPLNLRRPALELLVQLFPEGSRAGVWTFGQWVNNLVPSNIVDDRWREHASSQAQKINSVALHTNIADALEKAVDDIDRLDPKFKTHIILLTDGMVDISKSPADNAQSRHRIIDQILPTLSEAGVTIHTVALSKNADWELMERLAVETNGLAAVAETADDLTRIFLQAFDAAAPAEQVPLEGNSFLVDSSIEEFTALIFRQSGSESATLVSPENKQYTQAKHTADMSWFSQHNYDLITVKRPYEGAWEIRAKLEPESRVTIVSNLSLQINRLAKSNFIGDEAKIAAVLREQGENISRPEFLDLVEVSVEVNRRHDNQQWRISLSGFNRTPPNGVFSSQLEMLNRAGVYDITVYVDGKTFLRQQTQTVELRQDFSVKTRSTDDMPPNHRLTLIAQNPDINPATAVITAQVQQPDGSAGKVFKLAPMDDRKWVVDIEGSIQSGLYRVEFEASGNYRNGTPFSFRTEVEIEHHVSGSEFMMTAGFELEPAPEPLIEPAPKPKPAQVDLKQEPEPDTAKGDIDWEKIGLYAGLGIGNILVLTLGFFAYKMVTSGANKSEILESEDEDEEPSDIESELESDLEDLEDEPLHGAPEQEEPRSEEIEELDTELLDVGEVDVDVADLDIDDTFQELEPEKESSAEVDDNSLGDILDLPDDAIDIDPDTDDDD
ncbi:MAG: vWA domain-containing protein [Pseudomonadales bacterium]